MNYRHFLIILFSLFAFFVLSTAATNAFMASTPCAGPYSGADLTPRNTFPDQQFYCPSGQGSYVSPYVYSCQESTTNKRTCFLTTNTSQSYNCAGNIEFTGSGNLFTGCVSAGDNIAPTAPQNLTAVPINIGVQLSWDASTDNSGIISNYYIYRCAGSNCVSFVWLGQTASALTNIIDTYTDGTGLFPLTTYRYRIIALDGAGNMSVPSSAVEVTTLANDSVPPSAPASLSASAVSSSQINLSWTASTDNIGVAGYRVYRCQGAGCTPSGPSIATTIAITYSDTGLNPSTAYSYYVIAYDSAGNASAQSDTASATTLAPSDTTLPAQIIDLAASNPTANSMLLSWTAPGDDGNSGTASVYDLRYSTAQITNANWGSATPAIGEPAPAAAGTSQSMTVGGLSPGTLYYFAIVARDEVGNQSPLSSNASETTLALPFVSLTSSASIITLGQSVTLTWSSTNTTSCSAAWTSSTTAAGSQSVTPSASTNYSITCTGPGGSATQSVLVTVSIPPPPTITLTSLPSSILSGQSSTLTWSSTNTTSCSAAWTSSTTAAGSQSVTPSASTNYSITCTGPGGSVTQSVTVAVTVPVAPTISLTVSPSSSINLGDAITLSWITTGATSCTASGGWSGTKSIPSGSETLTPSVTADYILTCVNAINTSVSQQITVTVTDLPPVISNGAPTGTRPANIGSVIISARTNEPAYCGYNLNADTTFTNMATANGTMSRDTARQYHSAIVNAVNGVSYLYYIRCQDDPAGNENAAGYQISFSVANPANVMPMANMIVGPFSGDAPLEITADGSASYDTDGTIAQYVWQWGDGTPDASGATADTASHTYATPGTYTLRLTVTDNQSGVGMAQQTITVSAGAQPAIVSTTGICAPMCTEDFPCPDSGDICAPNGICVANGSGDGPGRSQGAFSLNGSSWEPAVVGIDTPPNFPANTTSLMMSVQTNVNAECQYSETPDAAYGNTAFMKQFYSTCVADTLCVTPLAISKESVVAQGSQTYDYYVRCKALEDNDAEGIKKDMVNDIDYHLSFTVGGPTLISGPEDYICWINENFIKSGIPYLFDICKPGVSTPAPPVVTPPVVIPPQPCVSNGSCSALPPACGTTATTAGVDNCGKPCTRDSAACPAVVTYSWSPVNWSACNFPNLNAVNPSTQGVGTRTGSVYCQNDSNPGVPVADSLCSGSAPSDSEECYQSPVSYNISGIYTFTVPVGVANITVDVWGGGGAGGDGDGGSFGAIGGGGGGGGGYGKGTFTVTPGTSYTVSVGTSWGGSNRPSSFGNLLTVNIGADGKNGNDSIAANRGRGGAGSTGVTANGMNGTDAVGALGGDGGKAGGAGGGVGGTGIGPGIFCPSGANTACSGRAPGGGGGGGGGGSTSARYGGLGANGRVVINW